MKSMLLRTDAVRRVLKGKQTADIKFVRGVRELFEEGEIVWVRETWSTTPNGQDYLYRADAVGNAVKDRSGIWHVPHWNSCTTMHFEAARLFLRVKSVRVERLQRISEEDLQAAGAESRESFQANWDAEMELKLRRQYGWDANPYVRVTRFERCERRPDGV